MNWKKEVVTLGMVLGMAGLAQADELGDVQQQLKALTGQVQALQKGQPSSNGIVGKALDRTTFGGYGELEYIYRRDNGNGKGSSSYDPHRIVLYVNSELSDWVTFSSELEWEHGGDGKNGKSAVEQAFLDFKIAKSFNVKAGVMLVPVGGVNLYHEPNNFNSAERADLDRILIPTTWREMGASIHGALGEKVNYELMVLNGLDGSKFTAEGGIRGGRQDLDADINKDKAFAGRLEVRPLTNLYTNLSFYTGNSAKAGQAYTTVAAFDGKYRLGDLELAGEYVQIYQDDPKALGTDASKGAIGNTMSGYWLEAAYHVMPQSLKKGTLAEADALVFGRYSEIDPQEGVAAANGLYDRKYTTVGLSFKPVPTVAIKADYQWYDDHRRAGVKALDNDKFQVTLGFVF